MDEPNIHRLPWRHDLAQLIDADGIDIVVNGRASPDSLRDYIVKAANAYPKHLEALRKAEPIVAAMCNALGESCTGDDADALGAIRDALAESEAKP